MCVRVYVCRHKYLYACINMWRVHIRTYVCVCICRYICMYVSESVCNCVNRDSCICANKYIYTFERIQVCMYSRVHACVRIGMCVCLFEFVHVAFIFLCGGKQTRIKRKRKPHGLCMHVCVLVRKCSCLDGCMQQLGIWGGEGRENRRKNGNKKGKRTTPYTV